MLFVSADDYQSGKSIEQHEDHKGRTHGDCFRKDTGKEFTGKSTDGIKHEECAVKTSFHLMWNMGLGCGNTDVVRSYTENSDDEASNCHGIKRCVKIERFDDGNADINEKCNSKFFRRRKFDFVMDNTAKASADNAEN